MKKTAKSKKRQSGNPRRKVARAAQRQIRGGILPPGAGEAIIINPPFVQIFSTGAEGEPPTVIFTPGYIITPGTALEIPAIPIGEF